MSTAAVMRRDVRPAKMSTAAVMRRDVRPAKMSTAAVMRRYVLPAKMPTAAVMRRDVRPHDVRPLSNGQVDGREDEEAQGRAKLRVAVLVALSSLAN
jgi:hypothetical protein